MKIHELDRYMWCIRSVYHGEIKKIYYTVISYYASCIRMLIE